MDSFSAQVNANTAQWNAYAAETAAEKIKVDLYSEYLKGYSAEVDSSNKKKDGLISRLQAELGINQTAIEAYKVELMRYEMEVKAELARIEAEIERYKGIKEIPLYKSLAFIYVPSYCINKWSGVHLII